ncbi:hypothetical protein PGT21_013461 [Puccinia graminis f. sp. tritici]|uniref:Uncharacterized protein n=1 Tax=Puccinia graminis f. sp. tritici TaxID=56615 RepID=A0A5B0MKV8_PUCGR|nr:hypothetical protein PGT21_013461 [Puccinia graminis f. sp. tritici]
MYGRMKISFVECLLVELSDTYVDTHASDDFVENVCQPVFSRPRVWMSNSRARDLSESPLMMMKGRDFSPPSPPVYVQRVACSVDRSHQRSKDAFFFSC